MSGLSKTQLWVRKNPEANKRIQNKARIKYRYGITLDRYEELRVLQNNKCAICKLDFVKTPHIDHCHKTNKVRELLCDTCNRGIGYFKEEVLRLKQAITYLEKHNG